MDKREEDGKVLLRRLVALFESRCREYCLVHPAHICAGTGLTPPTSAPRPVGPNLPRGPERRGRAGGRADAQPSREHEVVDRRLRAGRAELGLSTE